MRYTFKARVLQKNRSWFHAWGDRVIDASPRFEWMIGKPVRAALGWIEAHTIWRSYLIEPLPPGETEKWTKIKYYARAITQ